MLQEHQLYLRRVDRGAEKRQAAGQPRRVTRNLDTISGRSSAEAMSTEDWNAARNRLCSGMESGLGGLPKVSYGSPFGPKYLEHPEAKPRLISAGNGHVGVRVRLSRHVHVSRGAYYDYGNSLDVVTGPKPNGWEELVVVTPEDIFLGPSKRPLVPDEVGVRGLRIVEGIWNDFHDAPEVEEIAEVVDLDSRRPVNPALAVRVFTLSGSSGYHRNH